ncbi:MAG: PAS domain S-box protein [Gemmatimonadales bacterium]|nr:PAS domain S-box protein [Gemmatimonadales bacterium]
MSTLAHHAADPFRLLVESVVDYAIYMVDPAGRIASWNPGAERIYGYRAEEIIGRPFSTVFAALDLTEGRPNARWRQALDSGHLEFECLRSRKDHTEFWAMVTVSTLTDHFGNHAGFSVVTRDLSERKRAEEALQKERELSDAILSSLPGIYYIYDDERRFLRWNPRFEAVSGYSAEEMQGLHPLDLFAAGDRTRVEECIATVFAEGTCEVEAAFLAKDGRELPYYFNGVRTVVAGRPCLLGMGIDLTSLVEARNELRRTATLLRAVVEETPDALFVKDQDGKYLLFNPAASRFVGKPVSEVLGQDDTAIFDPESARVAMDHDRRVMASGEADSEEEVLTAAGVTRTFLATKAPFRDGDGRVVGVLGLSRDITEQKEAEQALRQREVLLRIAGHAARLGGWSLDLVRDALVWSDEIREIHEEPVGYQPSLADGIGYYVEENRGWITECVDRCAADGVPFDFESELITATGRRIWVRSIGEAVRDDTGRIIRLQGAFQDITARVQAERDRQQLADRLATTLESMDEGFITVDDEWRFTYVNAEAQRMVGRSREELLGQTIWGAFPETIGIAFEHEYRRARADHVTVDFEEYFAPLDKWFGVRAHPTADGLAISFRDVTGARAAERALRVSEQQQRDLTIALMTERGRLVAAQTVAKVGSWETDIVTQEVIWSDESYRIFGQDPAHFQPTHSRFLELVHPEDREAVDRAFRESLDLAAPQRIEHRVVMPDGSIKFVEERWQVVRDEQGQPHRVIGTCQDTTDRKQAEELLRLRERAIQAVSQGILVTDPNQPGNPIVFASGGFERMTGYGAEAVLGKNCRFLQGPETNPETVREMRDAITAVRSCTVEILNYRQDGTPFWNQLTITPVLGPEEQLTHFVGVQTDVTEQRRLEEQYRQSQKMEAVGRLAGGVAHDFNNLLTIISGYSEMLLASSDVGAELREAVLAINDAGERAATLTRQLLGFSRQSLLQPKVVDLNEVIADTATMLRRLIGEDIHFATALDPALGRVKVDPGQLNQLLMNLAVNARDAMPQGGKLTLETHNVALGEEYASTHLGCTAGPHVMLAITDTGIGMPPEVLERVFEPFFTTKEVGKGTGLGLAMVFGIVQQSGGSIHVYSEPGRGSTFKVYLPMVSEVLSAAAPEEKSFDVRGTETVLLVEDEDAVRRLARRILSMHGYLVLSAGDGEEAMRVAESHEGAIDLLLTDVVMPNLSGPELARALGARYPALKLLFMSGYTDDAVVRHGLIEAGVAFIQKPYTPAGLARKVRSVLDGESR